jgi:hypothetical protein
VNGLHFSVSGHPSIPFLCTFIGFQVGKGSDAALSVANGQVNGRATVVKMWLLSSQTCDERGKQTAIVLFSNVFPTIHVFSSCIAVFEVYKSIMK